MTGKEKISILENMMELDSGSLTEETELETVDNWDSMVAIELIAFVDEKFGKVITGNQIKEFKTIKDVIDCMG